VYSRRAAPVPLLGIESGYRQWIVVHLDDLACAGIERDSGTSSQLAGRQAGIGRQRDLDLGSFRASPIAHVGHPEYDPVGRLGILCQCTHGNKNGADDQAGQPPVDRGFEMVH
jgi:hypothetical protein